MDKQQGVLSSSETTSIYVGFELSVFWFTFMMLMLISWYVHTVKRSPHYKMWTFMSESWFLSLKFM